MIKIFNSKHKIVLKNRIFPRLCRGFFSFTPLTAWIFFSVLLFTVSCTEDLDTIGMDLIDSQLDISSETVQPVSAFTQIEDSVPTSIAEVNLLGFYYDPLFGKTLSSIYTEAMPPELPFNIPGNREPEELTVDSVVLILAYGGYFGDISIEQNLRIYELEDTIPPGTIYSNKTLNTKPELLHSSSFLPKPDKSIYIIDGEDTTDIQPPHLRVQLATSLGRRFIESAPITSGFTSFDDYRGFFKGLKITVEETSPPGSMLYFNLRSGMSRVQIYYHYYTEEDTINASYNLQLFNQFARKYSHFENFGHQDADQEIKNQALNGDTLAGMHRLFVQSMANFRTKIWLPEPDEIIDNSSGLTAINMAKLIVPVDENVIEDTLAIARSLILLRGDTIGDIVGLRDQALGTAYFGGILNEDKMEYSFNITQHLQQVMSGELPNFPLYLRTSRSYENAGRTVIRGPGRDESPLRLEIQYTQPVP